MIGAMYKRLMERFLDGPEFFPLRSRTSSPWQYRSATLALFAWSRGLAERFLTPAALALLPMTLLVLFYGSLAMNSPGRVLLLVIFAPAVVELGFGFWFRVRCRVRRRGPERVRAGSEFTLEYELENRRRVSGYDLECDPFPYAEGLRQLRPARLGRLPGRGRARIAGSWLAERRGVYRLYRPWVESSFPLGLLKWSCRGRAGEGRDRLVVYPAYMPLTRFELPVGRLSQRSGLANLARVGESPDLLGTREYRDGDEVRHLDWPGSARRGKLVVKEFEEEHLKRVAVLVDTQLPPNRFRWRSRRQAEASLEAALSLALAITEYLVKTEAVVELFAAGPELYHLSLGRNLSCLDQVCDILAGVEPTADCALDKLAPEVFSQLVEVGGAVVLLLGVDPARRKLVERLQHAGVAVRVLVLSAQPLELPEAWHPVAPTAVLNGAVRSL